MIIRTRIVTIIALSIILALATTTALLLKAQNDRAAAERLRESAFLSDIIEKTTDRVMREGNAAGVQKLLEDIGRNGQIVHIRILSPDGTVARSADPAEIGSKLPGAMNTYGGSSARPAAGNDTLADYFHEIRNRKECYGCHDGKEPVIGILQVTRDVSGDAAAFKSLKRLLVSSNIALVLLVSAILSLLFSRLVMAPLGRLLSALQSVGEGNWETRMEDAGVDELGVLGTAFNRMIEGVNRLHAGGIAREREFSKVKLELEHRRKAEELNSRLTLKIRELEMANEAITVLSKEVKNKNVELEKAVERLKKINATGRMLSSIIDTRELMKIIVRTTAELLGAERAILHLTDPRRPAATIAYQKESGSQYLQETAFDAGQEYSDLLAFGRFLSLPAGGSDKERAGQEGGRIGVPLKVKGQIVGSMILENRSAGTRFAEDELELLSTLANQAMVSIENAWLYESLKSNYLSTVQSLVNALEASDRFTKGHSERVRILSLELGKYVGLDTRDLETLEQAAILHDIGKIGIDSIILQKQGKLTAKEYGLIKTHPLIGDEILGPIETLEDVRKTILHHHERHDGNGYPYGLKGDEISLKSRILSVVDTFDAMMTDRPYRKAASVSEVEAEIRTNAGTQFDPAVVDAFIAMLEARGGEFLTSVGYSSIFSAF